MLVALDTRRITDWHTFHDVFAEAFGFPDFYGRNRNAWIDCMSYVDEPKTGMTTIHVRPGETVTLQLENGDDFARRCPEQYAALVEDVVAVNERWLEIGQSTTRSLSF